MKTYWGELYIDNTLARIEIGNNSDFESCTHREIQIPVSWEDGGISFKVNQGSFALGENLFLFVVDAANSASEGIPIEVGSQGAVNGPGQPGIPEHN